MRGARRSREGLRRKETAMSKTLCAALAGVLASAATSAWSAPRWDDYRVVQESTTVVAGDLVRTASTVQVGPDPVNRFEMVHVARAGVRETHGALLLLPPISAGFENYEVDERGGYDGSFAAFFARHDYDVWGVSQRTRGLVAGACEGGLDCSAMGGWGLQTLLDDADYVRDRIARTGRARGRRPVIGGVSLGSMGALAMVDQHPNDWAGAILLDGTLYAADPADRAAAQAFCDQFEGALAAGAAYDDTSLPGMKLLAALAAADPDGPTPVPGFPPGFTNHQVFVAAMSNPGVTPITPRPGYAMLAGDPSLDAFTFADDALAENNMAQFVDSMALRTIRDVDCGLAGDRTFTSNLAAFKGPVFVNTGGHGVGPAMLDTLALMTRADVELHYEPDFGHMDHFLAVNHRELTEEPILRWLEGRVFRR
jgi:pimeloyl-ACP methyl ester carboxylesterase